ncbi:propanediol utilization protein PduU [Citrobacter koseri]|nr:propanediol utilization protein PduU [Citrobacter koseri]
MEKQPTTERMIQEYVPGKQVTLAHLIANPGKDLFKKTGSAGCGVRYLGS